MPISALGSTTLGRLDGTGVLGPFDSCFDADHFATILVAQMPDWRFERWPLGRQWLCLFALMLASMILHSSLLARCSLVCMIERSGVMMLAWMLLSLRRCSLQ
jgi:hypothetical protein